MPDRTCSIEVCGQPVYARSYCQPHYSQARHAGSLPPTQEYCRRSADNTCTLPECGKRWYAGGLCRMHYARKRQHGSTDLPVRLPKPRPECRIETCTAVSDRRGLCGSHYARWWKYGDPLIVKQASPYGDQTCLIGGCDRPVQGHGRCAMHYARWKRHEGVDFDPPPPVNAGRTCSVRHCQSPAKLRGMCEKHDARVRKFGDPNARADTRKPDHVLTYHGAHSRTRHFRGPAKQHPCVECGGIAKDWAYDHTCPRELIGPEGLPFSPDPHRYRPMCRSCHVVFDYGRGRVAHGMGELDSA